MECKSLLDYSSDSNKGKHFFRIRLAGVNIEVECRNVWAFTGFIPYLSKFEHPDFIVELIDDRTVERLVLSQSYDYSCDNKMNFGSLEYDYVFRTIIKKLLNYNVFLMHGSVIEKDGFAYIFTAPSGIGKTTRTRLWLEEYPSSIVVNGDKPLIKVTNTDIVSCGTPWCGKEGWNTNIMVPIRAIFLLERADTDNIEEITLGRAFPFLLQQTHRPSDAYAMCKTIELLKAMEGKVKIYRFRSTPTTESVRLAFETAKPQQR